MARGNFFIFFRGGDGGVARQGGGLPAVPPLPLGRGGAVSFFVPRLFGRGWGNEDRETLFLKWINNFQIFFYI